MPQFDVHRNTGTTKAGFPLLVVVQSSLFLARDRRAVIPMAPVDRVPQPDIRLNPAFMILGQPYLLATQGITNVVKGQLGPVVASLREESERIIDAIDWLINRGWD